MAKLHVVAVCSAPFVFLLRRENGTRQSACPAAGSPQPSQNSVRALAGRFSFSLSRTLPYLGAERPDDLWRAKEHQDAGTAWIVLHDVCLFHDHGIVDPQSLRRRVSLVHEGGVDVTAPAPAAGLLVQLQQHSAVSAAQVHDHIFWGQLQKGRQHGDGIVRHRHVRHRRQSRLDYHNTVVEGMQRRDQVQVRFAAHGYVWAQEQASPPEKCPQAEGNEAHLEAESLDGPDVLEKAPECAAQLRTRPA
eukprot:scaffold301_cov243-Pinguiococcus_pyrenoidosus.AAC.141